VQSDISQGGQLKSQAILILVICLIRFMCFFLCPLFAQLKKTIAASFVRLTAKQRQSADVKVQCKLQQMQKIVIRHSWNVAHCWHFVPRLDLMCTPFFGFSDVIVWLAFPQKQICVSTKTKRNRSVNRNVIWRESLGGNTLSLRWMTSMAAPLGSAPMLLLFQALQP